MSERRWRSAANRSQLPLRSALNGRHRRPAPEPAGETRGWVSYNFPTGRRDEGGAQTTCPQPASRRDRGAGFFKKCARASSFFAGNSRVMFLSTGGSFPKTGKPSPQERARAFSVTGSFAGSGPAPGPGQATRPGAVPPGRRSSRRKAAGRPAQRKPPGFRSRRGGPLS